MHPPPSHGGAGRGGVRLQAADSTTVRRSYRGYGLSSGKPSEGGLQMDAEAALQYLLNSRPDINRWAFHSAQMTSLLSAGRAHRSERCIVPPR